MRSRQLFEYLVVAVVILLLTVNLVATSGDWHKLLLEILPNLIAVLIGFLAIHFFFTRRRMSVSDLAGETDLRREFRKRIIPAGRRLAKAMQRATEAYSLMSQSPELRRDADAFASLTYTHQVMTSDIFEAYSTLMENWVHLSAGADLFDPMLKAKEFIDMAARHCDVLFKATQQTAGTTGASINTALTVLKEDLRFASLDTDISTTMTPPPGNTGSPGAKSADSVAAGAV